MDDINDQVLSFRISDSDCHERDQSVETTCGSTTVPTSPVEFYPIREEEATYEVSDTSVQPTNTLTSIDEENYRIHLGTQPGYYTNLSISFAETRRCHSQTISMVEELLDSLEKIKWELIRKDAFSDSEWGLESYACIVLTCSYEMALAVAAVIGLALRQDAIGIYPQNSEDTPHPVFTVSRTNGARLSVTEQYKLMRVVVNKCKGLSSQFDENGEHVEFHDFSNSNNAPQFANQIREIIHRQYGTIPRFQITQGSSTSSLLESGQYEDAIRKGGLDPYIPLIKLMHTHYKVYNRPQCN